MAITHGTSTTLTTHTGNSAALVSNSWTPTAGRAYIVFASGQGSGGARSFTASSSIDGSLGTAKVSTGAATDPAYCWLVPSTVGGAGTITITPSGNMFAI